MVSFLFIVAIAMFWIAQKHPPLIRSFFLPIYAMLAAALEIPARR